MAKVGDEVAANQLVGDEDTFSQRWKKTDNKKKGYVFLALGIGAAIALACAIVLVGEEVTGEDSGSERAPAVDMDECEDYEVQDGSDFVYSFEGLACNECELDVVEGLKMSDCNSTCSDWTVDPSDGSISPVENTCELITTPTESPVNLRRYECPENTYTTYPTTGCKLRTTSDVFRFIQECKFFAEEGTSIDTCFAQCELDGDDCAGVIVVEDGCFLIPPSVADLCDETQARSTLCVPIQHEISCFDSPASSYDEAEALCQAQGGTLAYVDADDEMNIQMQRVIKECNGAECWFNYNDEEAECAFVDEETGNFSFTTNCDQDKGFCCEITTSAPTTSPTSSPTVGVFFVPENNQTDFETAEEICDRYDADLASIHSRFEQDWAYDVCKAELNLYTKEDADSNDCGCWIGLYAEDASSDIEKDDFEWTDGSPQDFDGWQSGKPDNLGNSDFNREEACTHMRPVFDGEWNDIECGGFCDSEDSRPIPLCRKRTDSPTVSPTFSPTVAPTDSPTTSPTTSPTQSPTQHPTDSPTFSPTTSPTVSPTLSPTRNPTVSPTASPTTSPTVRPSASPTYSPTDSPTFSPTTSPTTHPTDSPTVSPTFSPTVSPTDRPTTSPTTSPTTHPTDSPTVSPTFSPTVSPTTTPTSTPTDSPTVSPTDSPTFSPTVSPTDSPTFSPTVSPTDSPTTSPTQHPTDSPTVSPTVSPTSSPTTSPTQHPTDSPTFSPTVSPTSSPTTHPTDSPTSSPTFHPTSSPTNSPTFSPTSSPTTHPTDSPTSSPTFHPTSSPTTSPTVSPTSSPTVRPSVSPTFSPTFSPTVSPTDSPTFSPTVSPTDSPTRSPTASPTVEPLCRDECPSWYWRYVNNRNEPSHVFYTFDNPNSLLDPVPSDLFFPAATGFYPACYTAFCFSLNDIIVPPLSFIDLPVPAETFFAFIDGQLQVITQSCEELEECQCPDVYPFDDEFDYEGGENGADIDENWDIDSAIVEVIDDSTFDTNPCRGEEGGCVQFDGSMSSDSDDLLLEDPDRLTILPPLDDSFNRICTLNAWVSGSKRCGTFHSFDEATAPSRGCVEFHDFQVKFYDEFALYLDLNDTELHEQLGNISWDEDFTAYGVTAPVPEAGFVSARLTSDGVNENGGLPGELISALFDDISVVCCCPDDNAEHTSRLVDYEQGHAGSYKYGFTEILESKSDPQIIIGREPSYDPIFKTVYTLGIDGWVIYEFSLGVTGYVTIFEESYFSRCSGCKGGYFKYENDEDAKVEVSVDGVNWVTAADTMVYTWDVFEGGDDTLRMANVTLPNGACYKYIRLTDQSYPTCDADDGFDLHAIIGGEPCCPEDNEEFVASSSGGGTASNVAVTTVTGGTVFFSLVAFVLATVFGALVALTVKQNQDDETERKKSILEADGVAVETFADREQEEKIIAKEL
eukprot:maker-scaffold_33-snap-gene-1.49-mRNA-1 protein AED:0.24 eAED:0.24 QI:0/0/0/1/0/0/2/0/1415